MTPDIVSNGKLMCPHCAQFFDVFAAGGETADNIKEVLTALADVHIKTEEDNGPFHMP